ncbi:hypothetical protein EV186_106136 [Labedaea rhizosphaerae]|uniref:Uncharacterized protein n=1 Tax=Labedaea rhizosphaerae TaxID=598644 RepID=A0A4R6S2E7_LABRH|nr:hypothetical protein EV186_106136 [Labedaea rhizosphaerae]
MQNDIQPRRPDPVARVVFSHPAETEPMNQQAVQHPDRAAHFSSDTDKRSSR